MSIRVMSLVWAWAPFKDNTLLTLLALADWADDLGVCHPRIPTIAKKTRQSERNSQYTLNRLLDSCFLAKLEDGGGRDPNRYQINLQKLYELAAASGAKVAPVQSQRGVQDLHRSGEANCTAGVKPTSPQGCKKQQRNKEEPSLEPSSEPSGKAETSVSASTVPPAITIPLNDGTQHPITHEEIGHWQKLFPIVDVLQELREMHSWSIANPAKRKTRRGVGAFIHRWLADEQDKGTRKGGTSGSATNRAEQRQSDLLDANQRAKASFVGG